MAQAWASPAVSTAGSQAAPKIPTSCRRSSDRSQTVGQLPACLAPQFEPHVVPSRRVPRLSSLALTRDRSGCQREANKGDVRHCEDHASVATLGGVDPDLWHNRRRVVLWLLPTQEGLDNAHWAAAAGAGML